ncbi:hypothetical protein GpartN1_g7422.t1 [Galdieria partita]|uniref:Uncharacterized protein n=1 Tax=Galdieria partita TaxID=83374 RepID=A0A9C7Q5W0_9RHOD|nr:hypothetical protein GpartN1_g7422.t1 [Galdieria partita]
MEIEENNWNKSFKKHLYFFASVSILLSFLLGWPIVVVIWSALKIQQGVYCDEHLARFVLVSAGLWLLLGLYSLVIFLLIRIWGEQVPHTWIVSSVGFMLLLCNFGYWIYLQVRFFESAGPSSFCPHSCSCQSYPQHTRCCDAVSYGLTLAMIVVMYVCALMLFCYPCWVSLVWSRRARRGLGRFSQWIGNASDYVTHMGSVGQRWNRLGLYPNSRRATTEDSHLLSTQNIQT